jgi:hypothetical protein
MIGGRAAFRASSRRSVPNPGFFVSGTTPFRRLVSQWKELMRTYFSPRIQTLVTLCAAIALVAMGLPLSAQNANIHSNTTQADLRIHAIVVPAVALHRHHRDKDKDRDEGAVTYDLNPKPEEFSVSEEVRPMLVDSGNNAARQEQVHIITVVPK